MATWPANGDIDWNTAMNAYVDVEHSSDGTHAAVTATSVTTTAAVTSGTNVAVGKLLVFTPATELTILIGIITVTQTLHTVDTAADAASDDLVNIAGGSDGAIVILRAADSARTVVVKDTGGNLKLAGGSMSLTHVEDTIVLLRVGTDWLELSRSNNAT